MKHNKNLFGKDKTFIIAEAGVNHNGNIKLAKKLIDVASEAGADAIKFQSFKADRVISKYAAKPLYQQKSRNDSESQLTMLKKLELRYKTEVNLYEHAKNKNILFMSTPKDIMSAQQLSKLNIPIYKIGSSEINNFEFLKHIASLEKTIILSTGMSTLDEVEEAVNAIKKNGNSGLILLHCTSSYPCPIEGVNLRAMITMKRKFQLPVGYSDHTQGLEVSLAAVALGACVIEKHLTLDKNMEGPDHKISLEPTEFKTLVGLIRNIEKCMGNGIKKPASCESENRRLLRRSLVFTENLQKGTALIPKYMTIKRPGIGIEPKYKEALINRTLKRDVFQDEPLSWDMLK